MTSVDLPEPDTPVTHVKTPMGNDTVKVGRLCPVACRRLRLRLPDCRRWRGASMRLRPERYAPVIEWLLPSISSGVPAATMRPPWTPAFGPMSMTWSAARIVSSSCSTTMHGVAEVAQPRERQQEARVVALVQADRRLVEDVEHAHERAADLRRQPDALRLTARQRRRRAVERQVVDADVDQERHPVAGLAQDAARDLLLLGRKLQRP